MKSVATCVKNNFVLRQMINGYRPHIDIDIICPFFRTAQNSKEALHKIIHENIAC